MRERWNPFAELDRMVDEMNQLAKARTARPRLAARVVTRPATDVYETEDAVVVKLAVPGAKPEDLAVTVEHETVTIRGQLGYSLSEGEAKKATWYRREIGTGQFAEAISSAAASRRRQGRGNSC